MDTHQVQLESVLNDLSEQIVLFFEQDLLEAANSLLDQYAKLAPHTVERYSLEAMIRSGEGSWVKAGDILKEGISIHPRSFDLLYNLGYVYEQKGEILDAYYLYMQARYIAETQEERANLAKCLERLIPEMPFAVKTEGDDIVIITGAGARQLVIRYDKRDLLKRKDLLDYITNSLDADASSVLEIGFRDGIISKNLNLFGYDVTAVDRDNRRLLNVIALEAHDNMHQPNQKVAKFYHDTVSLEWLEQIPEFDVIIAVDENTLDSFGANNIDQVDDLLDKLLEKAQNQLFLRVAASAPSEDISKDKLVEVALNRGFSVQTVVALGDSELVVVNKQENVRTFAVPNGREISHSKSTVFEVDVDRCVDMYGISYIGDAQHFVELLKQYQENLELRYEDSILKAYYDFFKPKNTEEALFGKRGRAPWLNTGWIGFPWYWDRSLKLVFTQESAETRPGGNHHFGPNTDEFGVAELRRLIHLYGLVKEQGYQPEFFSDGYISGYLLVKGDDYRFVVTEGQHRIACLATLGYENIRCRFTQKPEFPQVALWEDVKKWPQVANGVYSRNLALKIFERFFMKGIGKERMGMG